MEDKSFAKFRKYIECNFFQENCLELQGQKSFFGGARKTFFDIQPIFYLSQNFLFSILS